MPLRIDGQYRGSRAVHVKSHRKLGPHRTITNDAFPVISPLISDPRIWKITFGKISQGGTRKMRYMLRGCLIELTLTAPRGKQAFSILVGNEENAEVIAEAIKRQWLSQLTLQSSAA